MGDLTASRLEDLVGPFGGGERSGDAHGSMRREGVPSPGTQALCLSGLQCGSGDRPSGFHQSLCLQRDGLRRKEGGVS